MPARPEACVHARRRLSATFPHASAPPRAPARRLTLGGPLGLGFLLDFFAMPHRVAVRNGRRQPARPSRDSARRFVARLLDGALGGSLLAHPLAVLSRLPERVCRLGASALFVALSSAAQGLRPPPASLALAALAVGLLAAAELGRPDGALGALLLLAGTYAYYPALLALAWTVGKPVPLSALRASASHAGLRHPRFALRAARHGLLCATYWALLLYGSDHILAVEVYRPAGQTLTLSLGQFALRLLRWSSLSALLAWLRSLPRTDAPPALLHARDALAGAFGAFSQICVVAKFLESGAGRAGREAPRACWSIADFAPRERPMRAADARRVLDVGPFADAATVRKAYRKLALRYHPDKLRTHGERARAAAEREFLRVQQAHQLLLASAKGDKHGQ